MAKVEELTLGELQKHLVKTIIGALGVALIGAFLTVYIATYKQGDDISELKNNNIETKEDIKQLKAAVSDIKIALSNNGIYTADNKEKIATLQQDVKDMKQQQDEMLKVLYEIKAKK